MNSSVFLPCKCLPWLGYKAISNKTVTWKLLCQFGETTKIINVKYTHCDAHFGSKVTQTSLIFKKIGNFIQNAAKVKQ
jgi:hypothetical protein